MSEIRRCPVDRSGHSIGPSMERLSTIVRRVHWFFVLGIALFVSGIGFIIAGARAARRPTPRETAATAITPVASVKQIMKGISGPAANAIFNAVSTSVSAKGVEEIAPHTDAEWETLGNSAAALIESG